MFGIVVEANRVRPGARFDANHLSAEVGENFGEPGAGDDPGKIRYPNPGKRFKDSVTRTFCHRIEVLVR